MLPVLTDEDFYLKKDAVVNQSFRLNICTEEFKKLIYIVLCINDIEVTEDEDEKDDKTEQYSGFIEDILKAQCTDNLSEYISIGAVSDVRNYLLDNLSSISESKVKYNKEKDWSVVSKIVLSLMMNNWDSSVNPSPFNQILTGINASTITEVNKYN